MQTYIAMLTDYGSLAAPILWRTNSIQEAREHLANVGSWQSAPDGGGKILLSDSAAVWIYEDEPPFHESDNLAARIEYRSPRLMFSIGPRGGIRREEYR